MLWVLWTAALYLHATALNQGAFNEYIDRHNYGYVLRKADQVQLATYDAQMIYHLRIPDWDISFEREDHDCADDRNTSLACLQIRVVLDMVTDIRMQTEKYLAKRSDQYIIWFRICRAAIDVRAAGS